MPKATLVQGSDGNIYGTTTQGGAHIGGGTIFMITPGGTLTTLHSFGSQDGYADGSSANELVQATDGTFYGTTLYMGPNNGGEIFKITPSGTLTTLYAFCTERDPVTYACLDGHLPRAGLVQGTDGNFYGTTSVGGAKGYGTIFRITRGGTLTTIRSFCDQITICAYGEQPWAGLVQATNGTFFGTTTAGGAVLKGTVFAMSVGMGWFVETLPTFGQVGATINILGTDFTGATAVTFNGTPASFTIVSPTQIQTILPSGATTGSVKVTIPSGTMTSNKRFRVLPQITSFSPTSGPAGTVVTITGVSLAQTIWANIGGVGASYTVVDDSTVTATVPIGATTRKTVNITTRGGHAASATTFTVTE